MSTEINRVAVEIAADALQLPPPERKSFYNAACKNNERLLEEVVALINADADADGFLEDPLLKSPAVPQNISGYKIIRRIASGGMGTVYEARQEKPKRTIAIKIMRRGITSASALKRFEYESQILAHLRHPGIAHVYEAGRYEEGDNLPYFVMEYIAKAKSITEYANEFKLGIAQRLDLFLKVCDAVHHGHQKGVIHRDLKPSNILVDADGDPKVIDFGVARATDSDIAITTLQTDVGQLIGTLQYMSPEQCEGNAHNLDTRSDVYSLGVVLYELLCGQVPYDVSSGSVPQAIRVIREQTPARPSTINRTLRGDLETITLKALEKERQRRYDSAAALADDIHRYLNDEPIVARPASAIYQLHKFARRNKGLVSAISLAGLMLVAGAATVTWKNIQLRSTMVDLASAIKDSQRHADDAIAEAESSEILNQMLEEVLLAISPDESLADSRTETAHRVLESWSQRLDNEYADKPLVRANIHHRIGQTYSSPLGMYASAAEHFRKAVDLRTEHLADHPAQHHAETLDSVVALSRALNSDRRSVEAEPLIRDAYEAYRLHFGLEDTRTLTAGAALVIVLRNLDKHSEALDLARDNLNGWRMASDEDATRVNIAKSNLASVLSKLDNFDEAIPLQEQLLAWYRNQFGDSHISTRAALNDLATSLHESERFVEAESLFRKALVIVEQVLGPNHPRTLNTKSSLASTLYHQGRFNEAEDMLREVLEDKLQRFGPAHSTTALTRHHLADALREQSKFDEAERLVQQALTYYEEHPKEQPEEHCHALEVLSTVMKDQGRYLEMRPPLQDLIQRGIEHFGEDYSRIATARDRLGFSYYQLQQYAQAEPLFRAALPLYINEFGRDDLKTMMVRNNLGSSLRGQDKNEQALVIFRELVETGNRLLTPDDWNLWFYYNGLGTCLLHLGQFDEAEQFLLDAAEGFRNTVGENHSYTQHSRKRLVLLYDTWGKSEEAAKWRAQLDKHVD